MAKFAVYSGMWSHWPLADALTWRLQFGGTVDAGFKELQGLVRLHAKDPEPLFATGVLVGSHPLRPVGWDFPPYQPFATPHTLPPSTPNLGRIPTEEWTDFELVIDSEGRPTRGVRYASAKSVAWDYIEFDRTTLMSASLEFMARADQTASARSESDDRVPSRGRPAKEFKRVKSEMYKKFCSKLDQLLDRKIWSDQKLAESFKTSRSTARRAKNSINEDLNKSDQK